MAEAMFNEFVKSTSDDELAKWTVANKAFINATIREHPDGIK